MAKRGESEKRKKVRHKYPFEQLVADYDGRTIPDPNDFYPVTFLNLSVAGASFVSSRKPETDRLVIALGKAQILVVAHVVRKFFRFDLRNQPFEIACEFERRA